MNISFVPEDIARDVMNYDLTPYTDAVKRNLEFRAELSRHPNVKVNTLSSIVAEETLLNPKITNS
jgi:hypothetical protein